MKASVSGRDIPLVYVGVISKVNVLFMAFVLGIAMSLTRQIIFLLPLILILPVFWGIDGVMYAGPIADAAAVVLAAYFAWREMKKMRIAETKC